jgi:predicted nucleic acid-binding protein
LILYLDTSALVKLYVAEPDSDVVRAWLQAADTAATSRVAYPEARAAFARRLREGAYSADAHRQIVAELDRDWSRVAVVELGADVARLAGELAERHALRGFDAIHLASAVHLSDLLNRAVGFGAFDARLAAGAAAVGLAAP